MNIGFGWGWGGPSHWGDYTLERGVGGSEAMMILFARAFAKRGHKVYCQAPCDPGLYNGVHWIRYRDEMPPLDWAFVIREPELLLRNGFNWAGVRAFLANDSWADKLPPAVASGMVNRVICISQFQCDLFQRLYPTIPKELYMVSSAGVQAAEFTPIYPKDPYSCVYASTPERGLEHLVRLWPQIYAQEKRAKLWVTSGFQLYGMSDDKASEMSGGVYERLNKLPGVLVPEKPYSRTRYREIMAHCSIMAYPSIYDEMCCIAALEAQAAGVIIVSTKRGALLERVPLPAYGVLLEGQPGETDYDAAFVSSVLALMRMGDAQRELFQRQVMDIAWKNNYANLAAQWEEALGD